MPEKRFDAGRALRAILRTRGLSQRELAASSGVALSTIAAIEAGHRAAGIGVLDRILTGAGCALEVVDLSVSPTAGAPDAPDAPDAPGRNVIVPDSAHDAVRDRAGRRFPAHLAWGGRPDYCSGPPWWGWHHIAWYDSRDPRVPAHVFWMRPPISARIREPREHPFWN